MVSTSGQKRGILALSWLFFLTIGVENVERRLWGQTPGFLQCSLSSAISRVCTHSGTSCHKTNSPTRPCCRYQAKHSKLTEEIDLLSAATTYNDVQRRKLSFIIQV